MPRLDARIPTQLPVKVFFVSDGTVIEELAVMRNLSAGGALLDFLGNRHKTLLQEGRILYLQLRLSGTIALDLVAEIVRSSTEGIGLRFLFLTHQSKSAIWEYVRPRIPRSNDCPYCGKSGKIDSKHCQACGLSLDFGNPDFFDIHEKETYLQQVRTRTGNLDSRQLIELLNSIDSELLKSRLGADSLSCPEHFNPSLPSGPNDQSTTWTGRHREEPIGDDLPPAQEMFADSRYHGMVQVRLLMAKAAETQAPVLILGESGTGKELAARAIHAGSARRDKAFVPINCAAIPESLLESELFGYVRGAFTGATKDKKGLIESAEKGTLFLDEIGEMVPALQAKLLRVLQNGEYWRVGSTEIMHCDVRILAATNVDLKQHIENGKFRQDLYYRMNILEIELPPLRERSCDIIPLAAEFLRKFMLQYRKQGLQISSDALGAIQAYAYPGNVRELENIMHRAVILCETGTIEVRHLPKHLSSPDAKTGEPGSPESFRDAKQEAVERFEKQFIIDRLRESHGNITAAASASGIDIKNFHTKMTRYGIDPREFKNT